MFRPRIPFLSTGTAVIVLGLIGTTVAHDLRTGALTFDHPWARATAPSQPNGAAYMTITNDGAADRIVAAASPVAGRAELHTHEMDSAGVMRMRQVDGIDLPAGETTALAPGGLHVMLFDLESHLVEGEIFPLTLTLENAGAVELEVQVESVTYGVGASEPAGHGHGHGS